MHALAADDNRGLIGTYTVIGWVIAGYLGATLFGMTFGTRGRLALRLGALAGSAWSSASAACCWRSRSAACRGRGSACRCSAR